MRLELRGENTMEREVEPFAVATSPEEAEALAFKELTEGDDWQIVTVAGVGRIHTADIEFTCPVCDCIPGNCGAGAMVWFRGDDCDVPYCSYECAMTVPVIAVTPEELGPEIWQDLIDCTESFMSTTMEYSDAEPLPVMATEHMLTVAIKELEVTPQSVNTIDGSHYEVNTTEALHALQGLLARLKVAA